jgi:hypothetical protein
MAPDQPLVGVPRVSITKDMVLREIMYHEFSLHRTLPSGAESVSLDEAPLRAYIQGLTDHQLEFLLTYEPPAGANDRLVVFIEQTHRAGKLMGADNCQDDRARQRANATFAVFHCKRGEDPVLICFTEEMCLVSHRDMPAYFKSKNARVQRANILKICAMIPLYVDAYNVWHRIVTAQGVDVMPGAPNLMNNSLHGEINTQGCWMLFRNFNWPWEQYEAFDEAYRQLFRRQPDGQFYNNHIDAPFRNRLVELGYGTDGTCTLENWEKAVYWDENRAYTRFMRHIVGIQYFSRSRYHSLYNTDGQHFHPIATQDYVNATVPGNNGHAFQYMIDSNLAEVAGIRRQGGIITAPDSLFDDSRLHFKRQQRWAPTLTQRSRIA